MALKNLHHDFHKMLCSPSVARQCIQTFEGHSALFMPSSYRFLTQANTEASSTMCVSPLLLDAYETSFMLNLVTYYILVLVSFTGLSTLLGMTDTVQAHEWKDGEGIKVWPLPLLLDNDIDVDGKVTWRSHMASEREPEIQIHPSIFEYLEQYEYMYNNKYSSDSNSNAQTPPASRSSFSLRRNYEFHFRLVGLHVIMLHLAQEDDIPHNHQSEERLHLVEVYHFSNPIVQWVAELVFRGLRIGVGFVYGGQKEKRL